MRLVIDMQGAQTGSRYRGIGRYTISLAKAIARRRGKHDILLALSGLFPETVAPIQAEFAALLPPESLHVWHGLGPTRDIDPANEWRREVSERMREAFLADLRPDAVLISSLFEGLGDDGVASIGALNYAIPTAVVLYDLIPLINPDKHFLRGELHQVWYQRKLASLARAKKVLAISESTRLEALSALSLPDDSVVTISGGCDPCFSPTTVSPAETEALWSKLHIRKRFILYTGGADERKNLHRLIKAYAKLPSYLRTSHQLVMAGKMPPVDTHALLETTARCGLKTEDVLFTGYVPDADLIKLYSACAVFVFPSLHEGFGLPPLEAMACGAPVVGANCTSLVEIIGLAEAMFEPTSIRDMTAVIARALTDEPFRARLRSHGLIHSRRFSWDESARRALTALEQMASGAPRISPLLTFEKTSRFHKRRLRILAIKLDHLGDFILAIPALSKLKARYPYASIEIVVGSWNVELAKHTGLFDNIYNLDWLTVGFTAPQAQRDKALATLLATLGKYDIAIDLRRQADTRFLLARVDAEVKASYATFDARLNQNLTVALHTYPDVPFETTPLNQTSVAVQMLRLIDSLPADDNDYLSFPSLCAPEKANGGAIAIFPTAGLAARDWEPARFSELCRLLLRDESVENLNIYFARDRGPADFDFPTHAKLKIHTGLPFVELARSLSRNRLCIANNSGGAHLASYLGLTVIGIHSGHELPSEWAPQFGDSHVIYRGAHCAPCHGARRSDCPNGLFCLLDISVRDVYAKAIETLRLNADYRSRVDFPIAATLGQQPATAAIVKELISSIAGWLRLDDMTALREVAVAISNNHPDLG